MLELFSKGVTVVLLVCLIPIFNFELRFPGQHSFVVEAGGVADKPDSKSE